MIYDALQNSFESWWDDICIKVNKAVVFLDIQAAEILHWNGGLLRLFNAGAKTVKTFSPFERGDETEQKVVFIITTPLLEEELHILQVVLQSSCFMYCIVITTVPEYVLLQKIQSNIDKDEKHLFHSLEEKLLKYMGNMNYTAEIVCIPIFGMNVCTGVFMMPAFKNIFPHFTSSTTGSNDIMSEKRQKEFDLILPLHKEIELKTLAYCLNSLFEFMQVKEDIFSLGQLSHILGWELESLTSARNRRKVTAKKISLLLIDRTLDLAGPLSQNCHSMLDRIRRVLPHMFGHTCDVEIDMSVLCSSKRGKVFDISLLAPGCLADDSEIKKTMLDTFISKKEKDCLMTVNRLLIEKATKSGLGIESGDRIGRITAKQLEKQVITFRNDQKIMMNNIGILQYALAIIQTLQHPTNKLLDEIQSMEQLLLQNLAASAEDVHSNLLYLITNRKERSLSLSIIMALISYLYALDNGNILASKDNEQKLKAALVEAIFQEAENLPSFLINLIGESIDENNVIAAINTIFSQLKKLNIERKTTKKYKSIFEAGDTIRPAIYVPLMKQLFEDIFNPSIVDIPDLEFHSAGFTDILKSGFSLFMNVTKPKPRDNSDIMVIVLGGITASEIHQIKEIAEKSSTKIIIGSTMLETPTDILEKIYKNSEIKRN